MRAHAPLVLLLAAGAVPALAHAQRFTIPESKLLDPEFADPAWGGDCVRSDGPGDSVDFSFSGLTASSTGLKDDYPVDVVYGQILPSHGNGDFSNFSGFSQSFENLDDASIWVSLFVNTGFTGPSGTPPNNPANDTFWQSEWIEVLSGETREAALAFDAAIPWNIADNPPPHTQGQDGVVTAINSFDRTELSAIGFQVADFSANPEATLRLRPGEPDEILGAVDVGFFPLTGWGPQEPLTHAGSWGGLASGGEGEGTSQDRAARVIWFGDYDGDLDCEDVDPDPRSGELVVPLPPATTPTRVLIRHLDGFADDSFEVYGSAPCQDVEVLLGTYVDQSDTETWVVSELEIPACSNTGPYPVKGTPCFHDSWRSLGSGSIGGGSGGSTSYTLRFEALGAEWGGFCPFGQVAFDWIQIRGLPNP